jgi:hypothetical protein
MRSRVLSIFSRAFLYLFVQGKTRVWLSFLLFLSSKVKHHCCSISYNYTYLRGTLVNVSDRLQPNIYHSLHTPRTILHNIPLVGGPVQSRSFRKQQTATATKLGPLLYLPTYLSLTIERLGIPVKYNIFQAGLHTIIITHNENRIDLIRDIHSLQ